MAMASSIVQNGEGTLGGASYSEVLQGTVKTDSKPVFLKEADLFGNVKPTKRQWLSNVEIYKSLAEVVSVDNILGIQRVGSLWRLYIQDTVNRVLLMARGVSLRGKTIPLYERNPYVPDRSDQVRVRIKNIPLSADDSIIVKSLKDNRYELIENPSREKLRVDGKLTNCETGDRIVFIKPPKEPLPKVMKIGQFRAVVVHPGQTVTSRKQNCGKCLQDTHRTVDCMNDWVCNRCFVSGHRSGECPMTSQSMDNETQHDSEKQTDTETERVPDPEPKEQVAARPKLQVAAGGVATLRKPAPSPTGRKSRERQRKTDKQLSKDNKSSVDSKSIQDYFKSGDNTPLKSGDQKLAVVHSPPTPLEQQMAQKKTKIRGVDGDDSENSETSDDDTDS